MGSPAAAPGPGQAGMMRVQDFEGFWEHRNWGEGTGFPSAQGCCRGHVGGGDHSGLWQRNTPSQTKMGLWGGGLKSPKEELSSTSGERDGGPAVTKKWPWEVLCVMIIFSLILLKK